MFSIIIARAIIIPHAIIIPCAINSPYPCGILSVDEG